MIPSLRLFFERLLQIQSAITGIVSGEYFQLISTVYDGGQCLSSLRISLQYPHFDAHTDYNTLTLVRIPITIPSLWCAYRLQYPHFGAHTDCKTLTLVCIPMVRCATRNSSRSSFSSETLWLCTNPSPQRCLVAPHQDACLTYTHLLGTLPPPQPFGDAFDQWCFDKRKLEPQHYLLQQVGFG